MKRRKAFSQEFKHEAVRLLEEGKKIPSELARELGIRRNQLYKWKEQRDREGSTAFPGSGKRASKGSEAEEHPGPQRLAQTHAGGAPCFVRSSPNWGPPSRTSRPSAKKRCSARPSASSRMHVPITRR
ncbi:MAG: transposase [Chlorobiales bacterium]|nr:transposase [Chlorobiales bacterium]